MGNCNDFLFLIDDLNKTVASCIKDKKEATLSELIQLISSGGSTEFKGKQIHINTMLLITAEYALKNYSSINRCLIIEFQESFCSESLTWLQDNQSLYINFLVDYITWICQRNVELINHIRNFNIKPLKVEEPLAYAGLQRLQRTYEILQIAIELYLKFLKEALSFPDPMINRIRGQLMTSVNNCIIVTLEATKKLGSAEGTCYVKPILECFYLSKKYVADSYQKYQTVRRSDRNTKNPIFFKEGECFCITGDKLLGLFSDIPDFPYACSKKAISAQLKYHGLLKVVGGECSFPLLKGKSGKIRYYHLYARRISELLQASLSPEEFDLANKIGPLAKR